VNEESSCPLSATRVYNPMAQRFHMAVANLRFFDVRKNNSSKNILFDFQDPEHTFLSKIEKAPMYGPMFWPICSVILKELNVLGKKILGVKTEADTETLRMEELTV